MADLTLTERMDAARDFPNKTCPYSRHAQMIAEHLLKGEPYPMLQEEPAHCGEAIGSTAASLWEARARIATLEALVGDMAGALEEIANCGQSKEPDHWVFRCVTRDTARATLAKYREVVG